MIGRRLARLVCLAAVAASATSCATAPGSSTDPAAAAQDTAGETTPGPTEGAFGGATATVPVGETRATFTESEVIGIARVASADAVDQAKFAQLRAENPDVSAFAATLVSDHARALSQLSDLREPPTGPDPTSALLQRHEQLVGLDMQTEQDPAVFELAYMTTQIATSAKMIAMLDRSLLPSVATARATRAVMLALRTMYVGHLVRALELQQRVLRSALTAGTTDTAGGGGGDPGSSVRLTPHK